MQSVMRLFFAGLFLSLVLLPYAAPCGSLDICCISGGEEGAGTGTVIRGPNGTVVLFDEGGGASWAEACDNLMEELEITQIDYAIASHYDLDHIGGLDDLDTTVVKCYDRGGSQRHDGTDIDTTYLATVSGKRYTVAVDGSTDIDLGEGAILRFLSVGATNTTDTTYIKGGSTITPGDEDNKSITALISYCGFDFYVGGDAMGTLEQAVDGVVEGLGRHVDVLHVDRHGSDSNSTNSEEFLENMDPEVCITSVWNNSLGYPTETAMDRIDEVVDAGEMSNIRLRTGDGSGAGETPSPPRYTADRHVFITTGGSGYSIDAVYPSSEPIPLIIAHLVDDACNPWPMLQHDLQHTGQSDVYEDIEEEASLEWSYVMGGDLTGAPALDWYGTTYTGGADDTFYALSSSGTISWSYATGGDISASPAVSSEGVVYIGSEDKQFYAFNSTGSLNWSYTHPDGGEQDVWKSSSIIDSAGTVYMQARTRLVAFSSAGTLAWSFSNGTATTAHPSSPAIGMDGSIFWGTGDFNTVYAINSNRTLAWTYVTDGAINTSPLIDDIGEIYIGSADYNLYALKSVGMLSWSYALQAIPYCSAYSRQYRALAKAVGSTLYVWKYVPPRIMQPLCHFHANGTIRSCPKTTSKGYFRFRTATRVYTIIPKCDPVTSHCKQTTNWLSVGGPFNLLPGRQVVCGDDNVVYSLADPPTPTPTITATPTVTPTMKPDGPWSMFHCDPQHTGATLYYEGALSAGLAWSYKAGGYVRSSSAVGSDGNTFIGSDDNVLYALSSVGALLWSYETADNIISSPAIGAEQQIHVGSVDGRFYTLDPTGELEWSYTHPGGGAEDIWISSPSINMAGEICMQARTSLVAFSSTGTLAWSFETVASSFVHESSPAIDTDDRIFWGTGNVDTLYAVNSDISLAWSYTVGDSLRSSPAIDSDGKVTIGCYDGNLYAFTPDGELSWSYLTANSIDSSTAIDATQGIHVGSKDNRLYSFTSTGTLYWSYEAGMFITSSPAIGVTGIVYVGAQDSKLYALNSNGTLLWSYSGGDWFKSSPAIGAPGRIQAGSMDNNIYAIGE